MQEVAEGQAEGRSQVAVVEPKAHPHAGNMLKKSNCSKSNRIVSPRKAVRESPGRRKRRRKRNKEITT